jgi:hypothetical protein
MYIYVNSLKNPAFFIVLTSLYLKALLEVTEGLIMLH